MPDERSNGSAAVASSQGVPPPLLYLAAIAIGVVLDLAFPLPVLPAGAALATGAVVLAVGLALMTWAERTMERDGEGVRPDRSTSVIVDGGPYYLSRNPIYVAFTLIAVGVALLVNSGWGLASAAIAVATVHFATVLVEERYLRAHIGDEYARYTDRVRRWL